MTGPHGADLGDSAPVAKGMALLVVCVAGGEFGR